MSGNSYGLYKSSPSGELFVPATGGLMKTLATVSWLLALLASFLRAPIGLESGDVLARILGSVLGIYVFGWILTILVTLFEKKETRKESRKATLAYAMILISLINILGNIFGGRL